MLPPKIGDGVLGSSSGGVNPTGASSLAGASAFPSAAAALMVVLGENLGSLGFRKDRDDEADCFYARAARSPDLEPMRVGVKREA